MEPWLVSCLDHIHCHTADRSRRSMAAGHNRRIVPDTDFHTHFVQEFVFGFDRNKLAVEVRNGNWGRMP